MSTGPTSTTTATATAQPTDPTDPASADDPAEDLVEPSTTARTLRRLRIWLVVACLAAGALCLFAFNRAHLTVNTISNESAPAVEQVDTAYIHFFNAVAAAARGIDTGTGTFGGLTAFYQNELAAADQTLSQLTADNVAGPAGTQELQLVQVLVIKYNQQVQQAYAELASTPGDALGMADLSYSMGLANDVQTALRDLRTKEIIALRAQQSTTWLAWTAYPIWIPLVAAAVALLGFCDNLIRRRFRRRVNVPLAAAGVSLVAMGLLCGLSLWVSDGDLLAGVQGPMVTATALTDNQVRENSQTACDDFTTQVHKIYPNGTCPLKIVSLSGTPSGDSIDNQTTLLQSSAATADAAFVYRAMSIAALTITAAALAALGLRPRIDEYKFGS